MHFTHRNEPIFRVKQIFLIYSALYGLTCISWSSYSYFNISLPTNIPFTKMPMFYLEKANEPYYQTS